MACDLDLRPAPHCFFCLVVTRLAERVGELLVIIKLVAQRGPFAIGSRRFFLFFYESFVKETSVSEHAEKDKSATRSSG